MYPRPRIALLVESGQHTIAEPGRMVIAKHVNVHTKPHE